MKNVTKLAKSSHLARLRFYNCSIVPPKEQATFRLNQRTLLNLALSCSSVDQKWECSLNLTCFKHKIYVLDQNTTGSVVLAFKNRV